MLETEAEARSVETRGAGEGEARGETMEEEETEDGTEAEGTRTISEVRETEERDADDEAELADDLGGMRRGPATEEEGNAAEEIRDKGCSAGNIKEDEGKEEAEAAIAGAEGKGDAEVDFGERENAPSSTDMIKEDN